MQITTKKKDIIWNYLGVFFSLGSQVIWLPVLVHYMPPDILGLWYVWRIVKLSATPLRNRPHMVFCSQGTSWGAGSTHGTSVGCNPLAYP